MYIIRLEYWASIKYEKKLTTFFLLFAIGVVIYGMTAFFHHYIHVYYFELFAPPPNAGLVPATVAFQLIILILFLRYHQSIFLDPERLSVRDL